MANCVKKEAIFEEVSIKEEVVNEEGYDLGVAIKQEDHTVQELRLEKFETHRQTTQHDQSRKFPCEVCGKNFQHSRNLKAHLPRHAHERNFNCDLCDRKFKVKADIWIHKKAVHASEGPFRCEVCSKTLATLVTFRAHTAIHRQTDPDLMFCSDGKVICKVCEKPTFRSYYKQHLQRHRDERDFNCDRCEKTFKTKVCLANHKSFMHATDKPFRCEVCSKTFPMSWSLKRHSLIHSEPSPFRCVVCRKPFECEETLKLHETAHGEIKPANCDRCAKTFKTKKLLAIHNTTMHATEKPFRCELCSKTFAAPWLLRKHTKYHGEEKPYKCDRCPVAFNMARKLTNHKLVVHCESRDFSCDQCDKSFKVERYLATHKIIKHATEKPFRCQVCSKAFPMLRILKKHSIIHSDNSGISLLKCEKCGKTFKSSLGLKGHMAKHNGFKTFKRSENVKREIDEVKVEPIVIYDSETKRPAVKEELEEVESVRDLRVKEEPPEIIEES